MKKTNRGVIAAGLCLLVYFLNELLLLIGSLRMYHTLVSDARLSVQALEAANLSFVPTLISSAVGTVIYLLLVLCCFRLHGSRIGAGLFVLAFLLEAAHSGRMLADSIRIAFMNTNAVCFGLMLVFCLAMALLKPVQSKIIWGLGGIALGLYLLLTVVPMVTGIVTAIRNPSNIMNPWWVQIGALIPALCRIAGFFLLWQQERPAPTEPTPE